MNPSTKDQESTGSTIQDGARTLGATVGHAVVDVPTAPPDQTVATTLDRLAAGDLAVVRMVVVVEGQRPVGLVPIERLYSAAGEETLGSVMEGEPPIVTFDTDEELAAHDMADAGAGCLVVVGPGGGLVGLVFPEQMLDVLLAEHDEDMARIGGYLTSSRQARHAAREGLLPRLWHRLPWLIVGLLGAMLSAVIMSAFESELDANVLLALFVPAIVYMAGAVGVQTQTVLIRAFAVGVRTREIFLRELVTGLLIGLVVGGLFLAFAFVGWGDFRVALAVSIALFASSLASTLVAMVLPTVFARLGADPAFGSGPLATLIQDLFSILVYFAVVTVIVF
ncbi:MAG: magnesium transporter [Solirubrobacterales bacterium]